MKLHGANIVITGASSGIGYAILQQLSKIDCQIVASSRTIENKIEVPREGIYLKNFDLTKREEIDHLFSYALKKLGTIDLYLSNAGFGYYEDIYPADYEHIEKIFRLNSIAMFYGAVKMKEISRDRPYNFVCTSSALGFFSLPGYALYCSTKAAIKGFAEAYRYELEKSQYFQVLYPIATQTKFFIKAGTNSPPKPIQSTKHVAKTAIKGIRKNKKNIYPSKGFIIIKTFLPFLLKISVWIENKKFRKRCQ